MKHDHNKIHNKLDTLIYSHVFSYIKIPINLEKIIKPIPIKSIENTKN